MPVWEAASQGEVFTNVSKEQITSFFKNLTFKYKGGNSAYQHPKLHRREYFKT